MASSFLDNLKKAVDTGEFNSEAAKKINEIEQNANKLTSAGSEESLNKRLENAGIKVASEKEALELNSQYEERMANIKKQDEINKQLATLIDIEDMVKASVEDMMSFVNELEEKFEKEIENENPMYGDLSQKLEQIKLKYNSIINN